MSGTFTDDDIDKTVENANGEVIGTVTTIEGDTARVEPRSGVMDSIKATLGWRGTEDTVEIHEDGVDEISSESIRLEAESVDALESTESTVDDGAESAEPARSVSETGTGMETETETGAELEPDNAAERDPGTGFVEDSSEIPDRNSADEMGGPATGNAAERADEPDASETRAKTDVISDSEPDDAITRSEPDDETDDPETDDAMMDRFEERRETEAMGAAGGQDAGDEGGESEFQEVTGEQERARETGDVELQDETAVPDETETDVPSNPMNEAAETEVRGGETARGTDPTEKSGGIEPSDDGPDGSDQSATDRSDLSADVTSGVDIESAADDTESDELGSIDGQHEVEDNVADELDTGVDLESAAESKDTGDLETGDGPSGTDEMDLTDELDTGVDIESATEADARSESKADPRPETELDPDVEGRSPSPTDSRPETELDPDSADTEAAATDAQDVSDEIDPGVDIEAAADPDERSDPAVDPDAIAGRGMDADTGTDIDGDTDADAETESDPDAAARELISEGAAATERETATPDDAPPTRSSTAESESDAASQQPRRSPSSLAAMLAAQQDAMTNGQQLIKRGLAVQQRAARGAVEAPLVAQRQGLEASQAVTRSYFDAVASLLGTDADKSGEQPQSMDEAVAELEAVHVREANDELSEQVADHLEQIQAIQDQLDRQTERGSEQAAALLERQVELLEACRRRLDASDRTK
ncbi:hypothetical protein GS429_20950 [Natronorubrum sp. JWXQ-INN-674]|uniref:Uncharacterized protein n=1 Tax=Natronorubrum halalkaliphilum TaxID=2691917 RepID=A0A6B0VTK6_9EURY|nr:hypothetical protein [Natronorubrum halalkaliphilum]MXV64493.1 hypothetical protein [Natronorubrum halalkaliphilum]